MWGSDRRWHTSVLIVSLTHVLVLIGLRSNLILQLPRFRRPGLVVFLPEFGAIAPQMLRNEEGSIF